MIKALPDNDIVRLRKRFPMMAVSKRGEKGLSDVESDEDESQESEYDNGDNNNASDDSLDIDDTKPPPKAKEEPTKSKMTRSRPVTKADFAPLASTVSLPYPAQQLSDFSEREPSTIDGGEF